MHERKPNNECVQMKEQKRERRTTSHLFRCNLHVLIQEEEEEEISCILTLFGGDNMQLCACVGASLFVCLFVDETVK